MLMCIVYALSFDITIVRCESSLLDYYPPGTVAIVLVRQIRFKEETAHSRFLRLLATHIATRNGQPTDLALLSMKYIHAADSLIALCGYFLNKLQSDEGQKSTFHLL